MFKNKIYLLLNVLIIIFLLALPYYLFSGKLYIGGDDTRLFYSYPLEFLKNVTYFSWYNVSSIGTYGTGQYMAPFLLLWSGLGLVISKISMSYFALSLPLILGFIFFQKAIKELFALERKDDLEVFAGSLFYILSPILIIDQYFIFLISIWLLGLIPIGIYYFLKYLKKGNFTYLFVLAIWCLILAQATYSIPWLLGFILPIILGLIIISFLFRKSGIASFLRKSIIFFGFLFASQAFWLVGFTSSYLNLGQNNFASKLLSKGVLDTFTPTIVSTATSTIIYPLLNLFHRQIVFDFNWRFTDAFTNFYDKTFILNSIFILLLGFGSLNYKKYLNSMQRKVFLLLLVSFVFSLYFFTVNIGPLKDLFIWFGRIPGFVMFRNFYDKFAPGYVLIYSALITICLVIFARRFPKRRSFILTAFLLIVVLNFLPLKTIIDSPLWTTKDIYKTINIPNEYLSFMDDIRKDISSTNNILSVPFGSSAYSVIKDDNSSGVYAGVSPVKIFSGVNDISGHLSFNFTKEADIVDGLIVNRNYQEFNKTMFEYNINYVLLTKNVPRELGSSYLYNQDLYDAQDNKFIVAITKQKLLVSSSGNYELYSARNTNSMLSSLNIYFQKISQVKYVIYFKDISEKQVLSFIDSYHPGWKLFVQKNPSLAFCGNPVKNPDTGVTECQATDRLFNPNDLSYSFKQPVFDSSHELQYDYANKWTVDPAYVKSNFGPGYYKLNKDGSIDIELVLYFVPQNYFYFGIIISVLVFVSGGGYIFYSKRYAKNKAK